MPRAALGTRASGAAAPGAAGPGPSSPHRTAGMRAAGPSSSPHDDSLALHVHLVEGELVGEGHGCFRPDPLQHAAPLCRRPRSAAALASAAGTQSAPPLPVNDWAALPASRRYWSNRLPVGGPPAPAEGRAAAGGLVTSRTQPPAAGLGRHRRRSVAGSVAIGHVEVLTAPPSEPAEPPGSWEAVRDPATNLRIYLAVELKINPQTHHTKCFFWKTEHSSSCR